MNKANALPAGYVLENGEMSYQIERVIGHGGFGITYLAWAMANVGNVAIKGYFAIKEHFVSSDCERDASTSRVVYSKPARERVESSRKDFISEARRLQKVGVDHPNIVKVNEVFEANNTAYYVMEYLEGESLRKYVRDRGSLSEAEMLEIMNPIVEAVKYLHSNRITHLDIKPDNIMLTRSAKGLMRPVLIDFGLSKHYDKKGRPTSTINTLGCSDGYAPVEQYVGITTFSPTADYYALGSTMWYCVTGRDPKRSIEVTADEMVAELGDNISLSTREMLRQCLQREKSLRSINIVDGSDDGVPTIIVKKKSKLQWIIPGATGLAIALLILLFAAGGSDEQTDNDLVAVVEPSEAVPSPEETEKILLLPSEQNGKFGYIDEQGDTLIPFIYDDAAPFSEGLAKVKQNGKYGYIDKSGNVVIPFIYDKAKSFSEGLVAVNPNGRWGYIDKSGNEVIPFIYSGAADFSEGLADVKEYKWGYIDKSGNVVIPFIYDFTWKFSDGLARVKQNGKWGFVDKSGNEVIPFKYDRANEFSDGLAGVMQYGKYGYIDKSGNVVIPFKYEYAGPFSDGLAGVMQYGKYGYIDKSGNLVIPFRYYSAGSFSEGLAKVKQNGKYGFINKSGNEVIPLIYDDVTDFENGVAWVKYNDERKLKKIDKKGNFVD